MSGSCSSVPGWIISQGPVGFGVMRASDLHLAENTISLFVKPVIRRGSKLKGISSGKTSFTKLAQVRYSRIHLVLIMPGSRTTSLGQLYWYPCQFA